MRAVIVLARVGLRGSRGRAFLVLLVLTSALAFALFAATGARRTSTAFDRFVEWAHPADAVTSPEGQTSMHERLDVIAALPAVREVRRHYGVNLSGAVGPEGEELPPMQLSALVAGYPLDEGLERAKVLHGDPSPDLRPDEGVIDFVTAERFDLDVGDRLVLRLHNEDSLVDAPVTIVGIYSTPTAMPTVASYSGGAVVLGTSFLDEHPWAHDDTTDGLELRLHDGPPGTDRIDVLLQQMQEAGVEGVPVAPPLAIAEVGSERLLSLEATAMWAAAVLALLVGLPIAYQLARRDASANRRTTDVLLALGASRRQLALAAGTRGAVLGAVAASAATAIAIATSPLSPVGLARFAEIEDGVHIDWTVLAVALPAFIVATTALTMAGTWRGALASTGARTRAGQPVRIAGGLPVGIGVRMATASRTTASIAGLGALVAAAALVVGLTVTATSVAALPDDARLAGGVWDAFLFATPEEHDAVDAALDDMPEVRAHGRGGWAELDVDGQPVYALSLPRVRGMEPAVPRGREPRALDEVALGTAAMDRLGVDIGDEVDVAVNGGEPTRMVVTGETILSASLFAQTTPDDFALIAVDVSEMDGAVTEILRFAPGLDPEVTMEAVARQLPEGSVFFYFPRGQRGDVIALERLEGLARALLLIVAGLALASLVHHVLVTARRHSGSLAVLRALGLTRRDLTTVGASSGVTTAIVTAVVAVPLGLALGSVTWRALARRLAVLPEASVEGVAIGLGAAAVIAACAVMSLALARRGARQPVAATLRSE